MWERRRASIDERFWQKVDKNGPEARVGLGPCWIWLASVDGGGYGRLGEHKAHRVAWMLGSGQWPARDVLHRCDTRRCVRFSHLFEGNDAANASDRKAKGRNGDLKGTANGRAILTADQVREIRRLHADRTLGPTALAANYGVSLPAVWYALRRGWKHIS